MRRSRAATQPVATPGAIARAVNASAFSGRQRSNHRNPELNR